MPSRTPEKSTLDDNPNRIQNSYDAYSGSFNSPHKIRELEDNFANSPDANDIDKINNHANDPANSTKNSWTGKSTNNSTSNIDAVKDRETNAGWQSNFTGKGANPTTKFNLKNFTKKKGPAGIIIALLFGGGVIGTSLLSPALLLVHMKNVFMNDLSDSTPALTMRSDLLIRNKIKGLKRVGVCTNKVSVRCKFSTMSNRQMKKFEKAGFTIDKSNSKIPGRSGIKEMTYTKESGEKVHIKTPQDMKNFARTPEGRASLYKAFNPKTDFFLNNNFSKMLARKFNISKKSKVETGDKKKVKESFDKSVGANEENKKNPAGRFTEAEKAGKDLKRKATGLAGISGAALCGAYGASTIIVNSVKAVKLASYAAFAMTFLTETDKLIAGNQSPEVASALGNQLTSVDNRKTIKNGDKTIKNPDYGKSPTDAQFYRLAAYGDVSKPNATASAYMLGGGGVMSILEKIITLPSIVKGGKTTVRIGCKILRKLSWLSIAKCAAGPEAAAVCVAAGVLGFVVIGKVIKALLSYIVQNLGKISLDASTVGPDVGNGYFAGAAAITGGQSASMAMQPANKSEFQKYTAFTNQIRQQNIATAVYVARATPFDIYNQYSFLGSLVQPINAALLMDNTFSSKLMGFINLLPNSFASLTQASAAYNMGQKPYNPKRFDVCKDPQLAEIGVTGDEACNPRYVMSQNALTMDPDANVQYMTSHNFIDPASGEPKSGTDYAKFVDHCVNRKDPIGSTSKSFIDASDWDTGKNCGPETSLSQTEIDNFAAFTADLKSEAAMDEDPGANGGGSTNSGDIGGVPSGDTMKLAKEILASPNLIKTQAAGGAAGISTDKQFNEIAKTGRESGCGTSVAIKPQLMQSIYMLLQKYKVQVGVMFDGHCSSQFQSTSKHLKGLAVDINVVKSLDGSQSTNFGSPSIDNTKFSRQVFQDTINIVSKLGGGNVNQAKVGCGVNPPLHFPPNVGGYSDSCTHMHVDVGGRGY